MSQRNADTVRWRRHLLMSIEFAHRTHLPYLHQPDGFEGKGSIALEGYSYLSSMQPCSIDIR